MCIGAAALAGGAAAVLATAGAGLGGEETRWGRAAATAAAEAAAAAANLQATMAEPKLCHSAAFWPSLKKRQEAAAIGMQRLWRGQQAQRTLASLAAAKERAGVAAAGAAAVAARVAAEAATTAGAAVRRVEALPAQFAA